MSFCALLLCRDCPLSCILCLFLFVRFQISIIPLAREQMALSTLVWEEFILLHIGHIVLSFLWAYFFHPFSYFLPFMLSSRQAASFCKKQKLDGFPIFLQVLGLGPGCFSILPQRLCCEYFSPPHHISPDAHGFQNNPKYASFYFRVNAIYTSATLCFRNLSNSLTTSRTIFSSYPTTLSFYFVSLFRFIFIACSSRVILAFLQFISFLPRF